MTISFDQIPVSIRVPGTYIEIDSTRAYQGLYGLPTAILVIGQVPAASTMPRATPVRITSVDQAVALAGAGSMLAQMAAAVLAGSQGWLPVDIAALDDLPAGQAAHGTLTFGGAATAAGTLALYLGGRRVTVGVAAGDSPATVATSALAALQAAADLPVSAAAAGAVVTLTALHKGDAGNGIDLRHSYNSGEALPAGLTLTTAAMAGGTGNALIQPVLDAIGDHWYTDIVIPYTDAVNLGALEAKMDFEFGPLVMRDGMGWAAASGSFGTLTTLGTSRNSPHLSVMGVKGSPSLTWEWAATVAGVAAYYLSIDPARPLQTLALPGLLPPRLTDRFTQSERNQLLYSGISTFRAAPGGDGCVIERCITTHQLSAFGAADPAYLDVETLRTLAYLRYDTATFVSVTFPRYKLANDGTTFGLGQAVVTPKTIRDALVGRFGAWEDAGLVEDIDQFKRDLIVERDGSDPCRVNALIPPNIINQLRVVAGKLQFRL